MALSDKNIVITPNKGQSADPQITFSGADSTTSNKDVTIKASPLNEGTLSFTGVNGDLTSFTNSNIGSLFSVTDSTGNTLLEVNDSGNINLGLSTGSLGLPSGTTAERPDDPQGGFLRWNTDRSATEVYDGNAWVELAGDYVPSGSAVFG